MTCNMLTGYPVFTGVYEFDAVVECLDRGPSVCLNRNKQRAYEGRLAVWGDEDPAARRVGMRRLDAKYYQVMFSSMAALMR